MISPTEVSKQECKNKNYTLYMPSVGIYRVFNFKKKEFNLGEVKS